MSNFFSGYDSWKTREPEDDPAECATYWYTQGAHDAREGEKEGIREDVPRRYRDDYEDGFRDGIEEIAEAEAMMDDMMAESRHGDNQ